MTLKDAKSLLDESQERRRRRWRWRRRWIARVGIAGSASTRASARQRRAAGGGGSIDNPVNRFGRCAQTLLNSRVLHRRRTLRQRLIAIYAKGLAGITNFGELDPISACRTSTKPSSTATSVDSLIVNCNVEDGSANGDDGSRRVHTVIIRLPSKLLDVNFYTSKTKSSRSFRLEGFARKTTREFG